MLIDIIKPIVQGTDKEAWLSQGKYLNRFQKQILLDKGWSTTKYTNLLFNDADPILSDVVKLCNIIGIPVEGVTAAY
jgi:hypothetical protein